MIVKLPTKYTVDLPQKNRSYYSGAESSKKIINDVLHKASNNYCMYCGVRLDVEGMDVSQIEHSVDKKGNEGQKKDVGPLTNCKFNLALACKDCNMKYKKKVNKVDLRGKFLKKCPQKCNVPCSDYVSLRADYISSNQIILQPDGVASNDGDYGIEYDIFQHLFLPDHDDDDARLFIQEHIARFHLNSDKRTDCVIEICSDIVELSTMGVNDVDLLFSYILGKQQMNVIGDRFIKKMVKFFRNKTMDQLVDFCKTVVLCSAWI